MSCALQALSISAVSATEQLLGAAGPAAPGHAFRVNQPWLPACWHQASGSGRGHGTCIKWARLAILPGCSSVCGNPRSRRFR
jgi:hypothetical protein